MNKKLTVLASAIAVAGSAQASFDAGTTFLYVAKSGSPADTFAVDLGAGGASSAGTFAATGLSAWLGGASANFAVVGSAAVLLKLVVLLLLLQMMILLFLQLHLQQMVLLVLMQTFKP